MRSLTLVQPGLFADQAAVPAIAGLMSAACMAWVLVPSRCFESVLPILGYAAIHIALTLTANLLGIRLAGFLFDRKIQGIARISLPAAAWLAPLAFSLKSGSLLAIPLAGAFSAGAVSTFRMAQGLVEGSRTSSIGMKPDTEIFHLLPVPRMSRVLWLVGAAVFLQASLLNGATGDIGLAAFCMSIGAAIVAWHASRSPLVRSAARALTSAWLILILAFALNAAVFRSRFGGDGDEADQKPGPEGIGGKYLGVTLLPDIPSSNPEVLAIPRSSNPGPTSQKIKIPIRIRFDGVYWFFRWPNSRPPAGAEVMHGLPDAIGFHSSDSTPLMMEGHQFLPAHIEVACCSLIDVSVRNADGFPGPVELELLLRDSSLPLQRPMSLGRASIAERATFNQPIRRTTLHFTVPPAPSLASFDQMTFRFYPQAQRRKFSPKIAIEDTTLIPR